MVWVTEKATDYVVLFWLWECQAVAHGCPIEKIAHITELRPTFEVGGIMVGAELGLS